MNVSEIIFQQAENAKLPAKSLYTKPCNHCGLCCLSSLCPVGEEMFPGDTGPCRALLIGEGKALCGLVIVESIGVEKGIVEPKLNKWLGIGCGCSMADAHTTKEEIDAFDKISADKEIAEFITH